MTDTGIISVVMGPMGHPSENLVESVASILNKNLYETGLLLAGKIPKIIARFPDIYSAEYTAARLKELGLIVYVCTDTELYKPAKHLIASKVTFKHEAIQFEDRKGMAMRLESARVFLILKGRLFQLHETDVKTTERGLNLGATMVTGGIPVFKKKEKTVRGVSREIKVFLRIYERKNMDPEVELLQHDIDYSFLGSEMASSSQANFNILVNRIREAFPGAIYDDRLMETGKSDLLPSPPADISTVNSRLMYLYYDQIS